MPPTLQPLLTPSLPQSPDPTQPTTPPQTPSAKIPINCEGSVLCYGAVSANTMHVLRDYMSPLTTSDYYYYDGQNIACEDHEGFPFSGGYYCAFLQGYNVSPKGLNGPLLLKKMAQLIQHGCQGFGSVPISDDNDPIRAGLLTINYVAQSECTGLCYYGADLGGVGGAVATGVVTS